MVIATTGHTEPEFIRKAWMFQMDEILPKPITTNKLKFILDEIIENF